MMLVFFSFRHNTKCFVDWIIKIPAFNSCFKCSLRHTFDSKLSPGFCPNDVVKRQPTPLHHTACCRSFVVGVDGIVQNVVPNHEITAVFQVALVPDVSYVIFGVSTNLG